MACATDIAIIASGFGGSVAALRAREAAARVVVLERGRRLTPDDLQRGAASVRHLLWSPGPVFGGTSGKPSSGM